MSGGQTYIVRLLRRVEGWLNGNGHPAEAARVGKIVQKITQGDNVHEALSDLHRVEGFDEFALRLMWQLDVAESGRVGLDDGVMDHNASILGEMLVGRGDNLREAPKPRARSEETDELSELLCAVGRVIEEIKQRATGPGPFRGIEEELLRQLLEGLSSLGTRATSAGSKDIGRLAEACSGFVHYVINHALFHDVRVVNILDNANLVLQTDLTSSGLEELDSVESTIQLLQRPEDLLD